MMVWLGPERLSCVLEWTEFNKRRGFSCTPQSQ